MSTAVLHELPLPARLAPWPRASRTTLVRCLWLAALLHLWAVLWLGSAPEGTAPPGQGVQGRLNVTLRGPSDDGLPTAPPAQAGPATAADAPPRVGGRVRDTPLAADTAPGAERLGERLPAPAMPTAVTNLPTPVPSVPVEPPPLPALPALAAPAAPLASLRSSPATALPAPAPNLAVTAPEAVVARLPELAPLPSAPAPAAPERRLDPAALRQLIPATAAPLVAPAPLAAPVPPASVAPTLGSALAEPAPVPQTAPTASPAAAPAASPAVSPTVSSSAVAVPPSDAGPRLGADIAVPATAASAPKRLNLELGRLRGGELSRYGTAGVLPVLPRPPETDKLAAEIEKAGRTDCRTAHAGAGLLAVVPLAIDTARGKGCKW